MSDLPMPVIDFSIQLPDHLMFLFNTSAAGMRSSSASHSPCISLEAVTLHPSNTKIHSGIEYGLLDNTYPVGIRIDHDVGDPRTLLAAANRVEINVSALGLRPDQWQICRPLF